MKFSIYCHNKSLSDNNGGTIVLLHHKHALEALGHEAELYNLDEKVPEDTDYIIIQSEWWGHNQCAVEKHPAKKICWLGHFKPSSRYAMLPIKEIKADYFFTQWKGQCVEWAEKEVGKPIYYLPHGYCPRCNTEGKKIANAPKAVFIGANYPERTQDWLDYANVSRVQCPWEEAKDYYRSAIVCPNIHGDFQKNQVTEFTGMPGEMMNDRIFNIIMSGGFAISDDTEIVGEFFNQGEVLRASNKEEFKYMIDYYLANSVERGAYVARARRKIINNYSYVDYWEEYLKTL